jgi:Undecaprenyl-phosphate glucose phosphotransferase
VNSDLASSMGRRSPGSAREFLRHLRLSYAHFGFLAALSDACAVIVASIATGSAYHLLVFGRAGDVVGYLGVGVILAAFTVALMQLKGLYTPDSLLSVRSRIASIIFIWIAVFLFLLAISFALKISDELSRGSALSLAFVAPCLILLERLLLRRAMLIVLQMGWLRRRRVLLITRDQHSELDDQDLLRGYYVVGTHILGQNGDDVKLALRAVVASLRGSEAVDEVHLAVDWNRWQDVQNALVELRALPLPVRLVADVTAREILQYPRQMLGRIASFELQRAPLRPGERALKRAFDVLIAAIGLFAMTPFLLFVALAIKIDSPGPILFRQNRGGFNGRAFEILKFRTMRVMENGETIAQATRNDQRTTRIGRWLRRSSVDELPQLINVLRGDMSLVGPRPHALAHDELYTQLISRYPFRHHMKPGMTGWAQVNGFRGETPTVERMKQRVELDLWYVSNWSFWLDLEILFWTTLEVFRSRNAF